MSMIRACIGLGKSARNTDEDIQRKNRAMSQSEDVPISVHKGEVTVDAAFLAPKFGLTAESFQAEMRRGLVSGIVEEGRDDDAGRTRVTFRYGDLIWRAILERDGSFAEAPQLSRDPPTLADLVRQATGDPGGSVNGELLKEQVRSQLCAAARRGAPMTYRDLALTLGLQPPHTIHRVTEALDGLMGEDGAVGRPFLAALAVSKARRGLPAPGFFDRAGQLGRFDAAEDLEAAYHARELAAAIGFWRDQAAAAGPDAG